MIVTNLISSKVCKELVYSKTGTQTEINDDDFRLWAAEAFLLIGSPLTLIPKVIGSKANANFKFTDYSVPLPCDFHKLIPSGLMVDGNPVRWTQNAFHYLQDGDCCDLERLNQPLEIFTDGFGNQFSPSEGRKVYSEYSEITFDIRDGHIYFNVKEGDLCMAYWSLPFDNEGYIMIPDTAKFKRAITDYIVEHNDYILWRTSSISDKVYQKSEENKNWSIASASMELKVPDVEQTEVIKNTLVRLLPVVNEYNTHFRNLGRQEQLRNTRR